MEAYFVFGCLMDRKMDYPKAAELLQKSIQLKADDPVAHYRLAHVYVRAREKGTGRCRICYSRKADGPENTDS